MNVCGDPLGRAELENDGGREVEPEGCLELCGEVRGSKRVQAALHERGVELEIRVAADAVHGLKHRLPDLGKAGRLLGVRAHG